MDPRYVPTLVLLPMAVAFLIPLLSKLWPRGSDVVASAAAAVLVGLAGLGVSDVILREAPVVYRMGGWPSHLGITLVYDSLTALVVLVVTLVGLAATVYAVRYLDRYTGRWKFYTLLMLMLTGLNGVAVSGDMFNLFVFVEISAVASYALVAFSTEAEGLEAAFKYMVLGEIGGMAILLAIALLYARVSALNMAVVATALDAAGRTPLFWLIAATLVFGFAIKMALVPFHAWLPDVYPSAPTPVAAMLAGVFSKVLGVYALSRVMFNVFGLTRVSAPQFFDLLVALGVVSVVVGGVLAYAQRDQKRLLAYSSISQVGYVVIGLGIGNYWGVVGALFLVLAHALGKGALFLSAGSVQDATGCRDIGGLRGLERTMPFTAWSFILSAFSLAGVPPFVGFFAKVFIIVAAIHARMYWLAVFAAVFSVVTLGYFVTVVDRAFFSRPGTEPTPARESPVLMVAAMLFLVLLSLVGGVGFKPLLDWLIGPAAQAIIDGSRYAVGVLGG